MHELTTDRKPRLLALRWVAAVAIGVLVVAIVVGQMLSMPTQPMVDACVDGCEIGTAPNFGSLALALSTPAAVGVTYAIWRRE